MSTFVYVHGNFYYTIELQMPNETIPLKTNQIEIDSLYSIAWLECLVSFQNKR